MQRKTMKFVPSGICWYSFCMTIALLSVAVTTAKSKAEVIPKATAEMATPAAAAAAAAAASS